MGPMCYLSLYGPFKLCIVLINTHSNYHVTGSHHIASEEIQA